MPSFRLNRVGGAGRALREPTAHYVPGYRKMPSFRLCKVGASGRALRSPTAHFVPGYHKMPSFGLFASCDSLPRRRGRIYYINIPYHIVNQPCSRDVACRVFILFPSSNHPLCEGMSLCVNNQIHKGVRHRGATCHTST